MTTDENQKINKLERVVDSLEREVNEVRKVLEKLSNNLEKTANLIQEQVSQIRIYEFRIQQLEKNHSIYISRIDRIEEETIKKIEKTSELYVPKESFDPIKRAVYSVIGLVGTAVLTAILSLVVNKGMP